MKRLSRWWWLCVLFCNVGWSADLRMPEYQRVVLVNGAVLLLMERHDVPLLAVHAALRGGALLDGPDKAGTAALLAEWMMKGAGTRNAQQWAETLSQAGASLSVSTSLESVDVRGLFLARDTSLMADLLADLLQRPLLDEAVFNDIKQRQIDSLRAAKDGDIGSLAPMYATAALFGSHPYARAVQGSEASLARVTAEDVRQMYRNNLGADRLILSVAGDFDAHALATVLQQHFASWTRATQALPNIKAPKAVQGRRVILVNAPGSTQTYFWIGNVGMARTDPRRVPLSVINTLFGGRYTSLINTELRIKSGLTYGARSTLRSFTQPGTWNMYSFTQTDTTTQAIDLALKTYSQWRANGVDATGLQSAQRYLLGQYVTGYETAEQWAGVMASLELAGLPRTEVDDYAARLRAVTVPDANRALQQVLPDPRNLLLVVLGDAAKIRQQVARYGAVTEISLSAPEYFVR